MPAPQHILERGQEGYPPRLDDLADPPSTLYVQGALPQGVAVALVGARAADREGLRFARRLAAELAGAQVVVISGGARGIDQAAHLGALDVGGQTVMVLGCGLEVDYPRGSWELRQRVADSGAVVSELPPQAKPHPAHFPRRNRIVAALSSAVVVVQAGDRSGALVTARLARELDRPVLAVPGRPGAPLTRGTHGLLRAGAHWAESAADVLVFCGRTPDGTASPPAVQAPRLARLPAAIVRWLEVGPASADEIARGVDRPVAEVVAALVELELEGLVINRGGCYELQ